SCEAKPVPTGELLARRRVRSIAGACAAHNPGSFGEAGKLRKWGRGRRHRRRKTGEPAPRSRIRSGPKPWARLPRRSPRHGGPRRLHLAGGADRKVDWGDLESTLIVLQSSQPSEVLERTINLLWPDADFLEDLFALRSSLSQQTGRESSQLGDHGWR